MSSDSRRDADCAGPMVRNRTAFRPEMQIKFFQEPSTSRTIRGKQWTKRRFQLERRRGRHLNPGTALVQSSMREHAEEKRRVWHSAQNVAHSWQAMSNSA